MKEYRLLFLSNGVLLARLLTFQPLRVDLINFANEISKVIYSVRGYITDSGTITLYVSFFTIYRKSDY